MIKKSIFGFVVCLFLLLATNAFAGCLTSCPAGSSESNGFCYTESGGQITITGYSGSETDIVIPPTIDSKPVMSIGAYAFGYCSSLTSVSIPDSVSSIGIGAFRYCSSLTSITIGNSVSSIWIFAFADCTSLASITIPKSVTNLSEGAFYGCTSLTSIVVDSDNMHYHSDADGILYNKDKSVLIQYPAGKPDTSFIIPDSVTRIGAFAFGYCTSLTSMTIPNSVIVIGDYAFADCTSLASITIPNSVTTIGAYAFAWCGLTSVTIPDSVSSILEPPFAYCTSLTSIVVDSDNMHYHSDADGILYNKDKSVLIQYPAGKTATSFIIPDSVTSIVYGSFQGCSNLTSITIPGSVTSIVYAFVSCDRLNVAYFLGDAPNVDENVFYNVAADFKVCYTDGASGFANPTWEGYSAQICECMGIDNDCDDDLFCTGAPQCTKGVCEFADDPCESDEFCDEGSGECICDVEWDLDRDCDVDNDDSNLLKIQQKDEKTNQKNRHRSEKEEMKAAIGSSGDCDEEWDLDGNCFVDKDDADLLKQQQKDEKTALKEKHTSEKTAMKAVLQ